MSQEFLHRQHIVSAGPRNSIFQKACQICMNNHNHYNFPKCDWCINCFIFHLSFCTVVIRQCNQTVGCNRTVEAANCTRSTCLNPPIRELITITLATTTYSKKNKTISKMKEYLTKYIVFTGHICSRCIFFFEIEMVMINW